MNASSARAYPHKRLDEVAEFLDNLRRDVPQRLRRPGPYPYFGAQGQQGTIDAHLFDEPLVLLAEDLSSFTASRRPLAQLIDGKTWVSKRIHVLRPGPQMDAAFLSRALEHIDMPDAANAAKGDRLTRARAGALRVPIPPLEEQRRIAAMLGQLDYVREGRRRTRSQLDTFVRLYFLEHFGDPQTNPRRWPRLPFGALGEYEGTLTSTGADARKAATKRASRSSASLAARPEWNDHPPGTSEARFQGERLLVAADGVNLVNRLDPVSVVVEAQVVADRNVHVIAANGRADLYYLHHALELSELKPYLTSASRPRLGRSALERLVVPVPPIEQQRAFHALAARARAVKALQDVSCERLDELYAALRSRTLSGAPLTADR